MELLFAWTAHIALAAGLLTPLATTPKVDPCSGAAIGTKNAPLGAAKCSDQSIVDCEKCHPGDSHLVDRTACIAAAIKKCVSKNTEPEGGSPL